MNENLSPQAPFDAYLTLLRRFLKERAATVERIQELLNAQRRPLAFQSDSARLSQLLEDCFHTASRADCDRRLGEQLQRAHWASGFKPRSVAGNDLIDPAAVMVRGFHLWQQTRWPGRNGRRAAAHTVFNIYVLRWLELLVLRIWDPGSDSAGARLAQIQDLLTGLWKGSPQDQPVLVRDARWLIPIAQSPTTDDLAPYFEVAERVADRLDAADRLPVHMAVVQLAGGHLRSQLRHYCLKTGAPLAANALALSARNSNALDYAITLQSLVPLLHAYEAAVPQPGATRHRLASAIGQGLSVDPELFINRLDLLRPYTMIDHLFIAERDGQVGLTRMGRRHVALLEEYSALLTRLLGALREDVAPFRPQPGRYSPYGIIYGFASNLTEHMALKALQGEPANGYSLEDVFSDESQGADKLAWVSGWRKLPHVSQDVQRLFEYPQTFAQDIYSRLEQALSRHASRGDSEPTTGRICLRRAGSDTAVAGGIAPLPARFIDSSDPDLCAAGAATALDERSLQHQRTEGTYLASYRTSGGWVSISKDILTDILGVGQDTRIGDLPESVAQTLKLMCGERLLLS